MVVKPYACYLVELKRDAQIATVWATDKIENCSEPYKKERDKAFLLENNNFLKSYLQHFFCIYIVLLYLKNILSMDERM